MGLNYVDHTTVSTPGCSHNNRFVLETKTRVDGSVRRRYQCRDCGERWTVISPGEKPGREPLKPIAKRLPRKLTLEQVYRVLTETQTSQKRMAVELGVVRQCIQQIRSGATWADVFPEIPRKVARKSCEKCRHWDAGECAIGFPDPLEEGTGFAADCDFYEV
jgi:transcriptional regulator NrdR family protein